jgi:DNA-binding NtrC family response regulator
MNSDTRGLLAGLTVLVVEDDYYQASDTQEAFELAGANVAGPFSTVSAAIAAIECTTPDCAVIDINLGHGPQFDLARELKKKGIPTVLVSGYQPTMIPPDLQHLAYVEKPTDHSALIRAVHKAARSVRGDHPT